MWILLHGIDDLARKQDDQCKSNIVKYPIINGWSMLIPCKAYIWSPGFGGFLSTTLLSGYGSKLQNTHTHILSVEQSCNNLAS